MFKLEFETDNAAFEGRPSVEVARILRDIANRLYQHPQDTDGSISDVNGNTIGIYKLVTTP